MRYPHIEVIGETAKALLVQFREREIWLPKSQLRIIPPEDYNPNHHWTEGKASGYIDIDIPRWLAASNRMLY